jgi:hypothetical protein
MSLLKRAIPASVPLKITEILPRLKDGWVQAITGHTGGYQLFNAIQWLIMCQWHAVGSSFRIAHSIVVIEIGRSGQRRTTDIAFLHC